MPASWKVYADWNNDGDFSDLRENITARILDGRTPLTIIYGRDQNRALSPVRVGEAGFEVDNYDRAMSPENTSSPLFGQVLPARPVKVEATLGATTYTPFRGQIDDFTIKPGVEQRSVDVTCLDGLSELRGVQITTAMFRGLRTGQALHKVLDAAGWDPVARDIDAGASVLPYWWADNEDAFDAALLLIDSEGPPALLTCDERGFIVFRDRHHRLQRSASLTVQSTWYGAGPTEPAFSAPADYDHGWKEIVNAVSFEVPIRTPSSNLEVVWEAPGRITIGAGKTLPVTVKGSAPFYGAITPVAGTDYRLVSGTLSVSMPRDSGESTTVFLTATGTAVALDDLQVRGYLLNTTASIVVSDEDASVARYGRRASVNLRPPVWANEYDTRSIVQLILAARAERTPTIRVTMGGNDTRQLQQLGRDLSDRVHIVETDTGLDDDCYIEQISHSVAQGGLEHRTVFGLEKAPAQVSSVFILGTSVLGTGRLGRRAFAEPATMFVIGSATNGVVGTNILAA